MKTLAITLAVLLAAAGCGGETPAADDTTDAATPAAAPTTTVDATPAPQDAGAPSVEATIAAMTADEPDLDSYIEFMDEVCRDPDEAEQTWGGFVPYLEDSIEAFQGRRPPEELRGYVEATVVMMQATLEYAEKQDSGTRLDEGTVFAQFMESPDVSAAMTTLTQAQGALDPVLASRVQAAGC